MIKYRHGRYRSPAGFTLVEMLVVVIIILLLSMILLRTLAHFGEEARRKKCVHDLEQLQNALNEYNVEYGSYPPVNTVLYEYESRTNQTPAFRQWLTMHDDPDTPAAFFPDTNEREVEWPKPGHADWNLGYKYGLVSYLWQRAMGDQVHWYDKDSNRDQAAKGKWASYLTDVGLSGGGKGHTNVPSMGISAKWTNMTATITDPWGHEFQYRCPPPYIRYRLWSDGPDGKTGTKDDVTYKAWDE